MRVVLTQFQYAHTPERALEIAREARMQGKRSEIITDEEYDVRQRIMGNMQDLILWANKNGVDFEPSI